MPSFTDLKARAVKAKDAGVEKYQHTRDRHTSTPLKNTNWDPYSGKPPPPPPPPRVNSSNRPQAAVSFPPPPSRSNSSPSVPSPPPPPPPRGPSLPPRSQNQSPAFPTPSAPARPPLPTRKPSSGPPPVVRSTRPDSSPRPSFPPPAQAIEEPELELDWCNLNLEDKQVFFDWLDEYFGRSLNITITPR